MVIAAKLESGIDELEHRELQHIAASLTRAFADVATPEQVSALVGAATAELDDAAVRRFIQILVRRRVADQLRRRRSDTG